MDHFVFRRFSFSILPVTELCLPSYKGSMLRGGFGRAFRRSVCISRNKVCTDCLISQTCAFYWIFETPVPDDSNIMRKYPTAPHPFILEPPLTRRRIFQKGDALDFSLTLVGRAVDYLPYFIYAFEELGRLGIGRDRGKFSLQSVTVASLADADHKAPLSIYDGKDKTFRPPDRLNCWTELLAKPPPSRLHLRFLTPARIKYNSHFTKDLEFHILFRSLLRRISLLSYFHCGYKIDDNGFRELIDLAKQVRIVKKVLYWKDWQRWSNRQKTKMKMGGVMGEVTYEGDVEPFWPWIRLGEYVHVGKGSSFGLGRYEVVNGLKEDFKNENQ